MGCFASKDQDSGGNRKQPVNIGEVIVFVPGLRIPKPVDFSAAFAGQLSKSMVERLTVLRSRIVVMAGQEGPTITRTKRKSSTQYGGSVLADFQQALEDYLPVLLGLVKDGNRLQHEVSYAWINHEDDAEEHVVANAWYEVLSVLHLMAMLLFYQANSLLLPRASTDGYQPKVSEESKRASVDIFLKAAGYLDCAVRDVLPCLPPDIRRNLPVDLSEGVLRALCLQALGQAVEIQLGMAIDSAKATLAVKRRLACEMVKYWQQALDNITNLPLASGWGEKHQLFIKWKLIEAKAAAYYYHGLILDEGNTEKSHGMAVAALQAADEYLKESKKACERFNAAPPLSLMNDGTIDAIRLKILNQLKANEDLKKNTITMVEQSKVLNTPGAEKQTKRELFDSLRQELEAPVLEKASKAVWELILDSSGLGKEIGETVEKVFCRLSGFETPIFPSSAEAPPIAADTEMANASSSSKKRKIDKVIQNEKTTEVRPSNTPASKPHDGNHAAPSH